MEIHFGGSFSRFILEIHFGDILFGAVEDSLRGFFF